MLAILAPVQLNPHPKQARVGASVVKPEQSQSLTEAGGASLIPPTSCLLATQTSDTISSLCFSTAVQDLVTAHRGKSREWGRLKAKAEPLLTLGNTGKSDDETVLGRRK